MSATGPSRRPTLLLVPLMGPFHLRFPRYNAVTVRDLVAAFGPRLVATSALAPDAFREPRWRDTPELALPLALAPWAERQGVPLVGVAEPSPDPEASDDFVRYLRRYPQQRALLDEVEAARRPLTTLLEEPLDLPRILADVVPVVRHYLELREARFEEGPGSDWLRRRSAVVAERVLASGAERIAVLVGIDHYPFVHDALAERALLTPPPEVAESVEAVERGLLDFAMRVDVPEPGNVIARLRRLEGAEARYHEANLLLAGGHLAEALELLERASRGDFSRPYYLPGFLLARLGQLYDLSGERDGAVRAYRGVRALEYAPPEALAAAAAGLDAPFGRAAQDRDG